MDWTFWVPLLVLSLCFVLGVCVEPRRFGLGILLLITLSVVLVGGSTWLLMLVHKQLGYTALVWTLMTSFLGITLFVVVLGVFLLMNSLAMMKKEGFSKGALVSLSVGMFLMLYPVLAIVVMQIFPNSHVNGLLILFFFPAFYMAFMFISFLLYSTLYVWLMNHCDRPVDAVIVLGAGLIDGDRVTPLLASRIDLGRKVFEHSTSAGRSPILIVSGGKGDVETLSEAQAMANYLESEGFDGNKIFLEDQSSDTQENIEYSKHVVETHAHGEKVALATNNFHAFRAAIIMRKSHVKGYAAGCRTARYYWPSAMIREFLAILLEHARLNSAFLALLSLPFIISVGKLVVSVFS